MEPAKRDSGRRELRSLWDEWRRGRAEKLAAALWPMLQRLGEANKAGLLVEVGAGGGDLAIALSRRVAWRDLLALEGDRGFLERGLRTAASDPALHRLDFCRTAGLDEIGSPRLPLWGDEASGVLALGALGLAVDAAGLLRECVRVARSGAPLLLAEPVGAWLGDGAKLPKELIRPANWLAGLAGEVPTLEILSASEKQMGLGFLLAKKKA